METKKCPKCGAEIPVEMSFCLHCMERTDGVLEIRKKSVPSRKYIIAVMIAFAIMTAVIVLLILSLNRKKDHDSSDNSASLTATETTSDSTNNHSGEEAAVPDGASESANAATEQITATPQTETATTSTVTAVNQNNTAQKPETTEEASENEQLVDQTSIPQATHDNNPPTEQTTTENSATVNFEEIFTQRLNSWGASHVLTDTLSFSENGCTFTSNVGTDKVNCTVTANSDMTDFTLIIEPATEYTRYSTSVYIPDLVNEITYFVLDYRMSSSMRTDIGLMFENFESDGSFTENELNCNISTQSHNNGSYPITVSCTLH